MPFTNGYVGSEILLTVCVPNGSLNPFFTKEVLKKRLDIFIILLLLLPINLLLFCLSFSALSFFLHVFCKIFICH